MSVPVKSPRSPVQILPLHQRPVCSLNEACSLSTLSRRTMTGLIASGAVASRKIGRRRLVSVASLLAFLAPPVE